MSTKQFGTYLISNDETKIQLIDINEINYKKNILNITIPDTFDGRQVWKEYLPLVPNQSSCKSCWAFTSVYVFSSRLAIYTKGKYKLEFSPAKMIFGKNNDYSSLNNWENIKTQLGKSVAFDFSSVKQLTTKIIEPPVQSMLETVQFLYRFGVCENECADVSLTQNVYSSIQLFSQTYDQCPNKNHDEMINHRIDGYYYVPGTRSKNSKFSSGNESMIRRDIYHWGPVCTVMRVFSDFYFWDGKGIYQYDERSTQIESYGHSVIIVGWDTENNTKYWICCNTWGSDWGDNGYFKIIRGVNNCEIEENVFGLYPALPGIRLFLEVPILYTFEDFIMRSLWGVKDNGYKITSYEKVMLKKKNVSLYEKEYIYDPESWPDFSKLIAGNLETLVYNVKTITEKYENIEKYKHKHHNTKTQPFTIVIIIMLLIIVIKILHKYCI